MLRASIASIAAVESHITCQLTLDVEGLGGRTNPRNCHAMEKKTIRARKVSEYPGNLKYRTPRISDIIRGITGAPGRKGIVVINT
jgi:hypothetical protein